MYYASFMLIKDAAYELNQNYDDISCVTGVTGTTGTKFYTQHTGFNILKEFGYAVEKSQSESKKMDICGLGKSKILHGRNQSPTE